MLAQHSGTQTIRFLPGIGQQVGGAWQYLHANALGNVRQVTDTTGAVLGSLSPLGFTGEPQDGASGLTYLRAR